MKCGFIVFLLLLAFICTFSEGKRCTGRKHDRYMSHVKDCKNKGGECCSEFEDGEFATWDGGSEFGSCGWCWSGPPEKVGSDNGGFIYWLRDATSNAIIAFEGGKMVGKILEKGCKSFFGKYKILDKGCEFLGM